MTFATTQPVHMGTRRFSEGMERLPVALETRLSGRFGRGVERSPGARETTSTRRFSEGLEHNGESAYRTPGQP